MRVAPTNDLKWMKYAFRLACKAKDRGEVPVGAVVVDADQRLIGVGYNQTIANSDPSAHAEVIAIRRAAKRLQQHRLTDCTLYVTLEPCTMCAGTLVQARVQRVVFATRDFKSGAAGSVCNVLSGHPFNHQVQIDEGPLSQACRDLLRDFFRCCRTSGTDCLS